MGPTHTRQIAFWLLWLAALGGASGARAQFGADLNSPQSGQVRQMDSIGAHGESSSVAQELIARQLKRQREEHLKQMYSDTARLLQLATDLKAQVDHSEKPTPGELKEVDEIGKLAKRVSERIKTQ